MDGSCDRLVSINLVCRLCVSHLSLNGRERERDSIVLILKNQRRPMMCSDPAKDSNSLISRRRNDPLFLDSFGTVGSNQFEKPFTAFLTNLVGKDTNSALSYAKNRKFLIFPSKLLTPKLCDGRKTYVQPRPPLYVFQQVCLAPVCYVGPVFIQNLYINILFYFFMLRDEG